MFDRERTESQDIEFDFFDESPTAEATPRGDGLRRRRKLPPRPPAPPGGPQLYRLGVLIAGAIVLAVILILVVNSCRGNQRQAEYEGYVEDVSAVASESAALGRTLNERLTTPGIRLEDLRSDVEGLQRQQEQILRSTQALRPPGTLIEQQRSLVEAMQFRVNGLRGLAAALGEVAQATDADQASGQLAEVTRRLLAGDVLYADAFQAPTATILREQDIGVAVPESVFLLNPNLAATAEWRPVVQRLTQGPQGGGGLHGNGIEGVVAQPGGQELSPSEDNTVQATDQLAFQVRVQNSGDNQEVQVPVTLIIQQDPVIRKRQVIDQINPGETKTLTFRDLGSVSFATRVILRVTVEPVAGEENTSNNTVQYRVIFALS